MICNSRAENGLVFTICKNKINIFLKIGKSFIRQCHMLSPAQLLCRTGTPGATKQEINTPSLQVEGAAAVLDKAQYEAPCAKHKWLVNVKVFFFK